MKHTSDKTRYAKFSSLIPPPCSVQIFSSAPCSQIRSIYDLLSSK